MKLTTRRYLTLVLIIQSLIGLAYSKKSSAKSSKAWAKPFTASAEGYLSFANLSYCSAEKIKDLKCPLCSAIVDSGFINFASYKKIVKEREYTFAVLISSVKNQVVVSFSGPAQAEAEFLVSINKSKLTNFDSKGETQVESDYLDVYMGDFAAELEKALKKYQTYFKANQFDHQYVFVGHQIGGALATLASFDMIKKGIISKNEKLISPVIYSYGGLRIGNAAFVDEINKSINLIRINKAGDANTRLTGCEVSKKASQYNCDFNVSAKHISPEIQNYMKNYIGNKTVQSGFVNAYKKSRSSSGAYSFLELSNKTKVTKKTKKSKKWAYPISNPGVIQSEHMTDFDRNGVDYAGFSLSQPLGVEVLYSDDFKSKKTCDSTEILECEKGLKKKVNVNEGNTYFNKIVNKC